MTYDLAEEVEMGFLGRDMFVLPNLIRFQSV